MSAAMTKNEIDVKIDKLNLDWDQFKMLSFLLTEILFMLSQIVLIDSPDSSLLSFAEYLYF